MPGGSEIWIETTPIRNPTLPTQDGDIGAVETTTEIFALESLQETIGEIAKVLKGAVDRAKPTSASIEFGIEVGIESGKLTALWVKGSAKANVKVTLNWG